MVGVCLLGGALVLSGCRHGAILNSEGSQTAVLYELEVVEVAVVGRSDLYVFVPPELNTLFL
jgi:hypothetical protein